MIPANRHSLLSAQLAITQGFDGMALGMLSSDLPRQSDKCKPEKPYICNLELLPGSAGKQTGRKNFEDRTKRINPECIKNT